MRSKPSGTGTGLADDHAQEDLISTLKQIRDGRDLRTLLQAERQRLFYEAAHYANTPQTKTSVRNALPDIDLAINMADMVEDADSYRVVNQAFRHAQNRVGSLPRDEARQVFKSHAMRLRGLDKARGTLEHKYVLEARRTNLSAAKELYEELQKAALLQDGGGSLAP